MTDVRHAERADRDRVGGILADAFSTDPVARWILRGPRDQREAERRLGFMFGALVGLALKKAGHEVYVAEDGSGAALWRGIDDWKVPPGDIVRSTPAMIRSWGFGNPRGL